MNLIGNVVFMKSYGGGQIYGETTVLKLKNNVFDDGSDNSSINN